MTMKCTICSHSKRLQIDREIIEGGNLSKIARKYKVSYNAIYYHSNNHLTRQLIQAYATKETNENFDLLGRIDKIVTRTEKIFHRNFDEGKDGVALKALDSQRNTFELLAKISYTLHQVKLAEIECMTIDKQENTKHQEFANKMDVLNMPEMEMLNKLVKKVENSDAKTIIIPEPSDNIRGEADVILNKVPKQSRTKPKVEKSIKPKRIRTQQPEDENLKVKPIPPVDLDPKKHKDDDDNENTFNKGLFSDF